MKIGLYSITYLGIWYRGRALTMPEVVDRAATIGFSLKEAGRMAEGAGVTLALQNHQPVLRGYQDMLDMIYEVDSPALQACLDVPLLERQDDEYVWQATQATGRLQALSHYNGEF